ncbi:MAG: long-chain fatty acid--CoA ligase [Candidatus Aminicenantes bacterium]|nr:long-chain fatty acid--CoA ligase [Candidatus Aminicenantes bacterium]
MLEKSIYESFNNVCEKNKDKIAYRYKKGIDWKPVTWGEHQETCKKISKSLMALGIEKGDKVNILSQTRLEWIQVDIATVSIGAIIVGIYANNLPDDCAYIINHSDAVVLFVEDQEQLDKIFKVRNNLPDLKHIVIIDGESSGAEGVMTWQEFITKGINVTDNEFLARTVEMRPGDVASIVYTSGTTGVPKGAMLTHENLVFTSWSVIQSLLIEPHFETILFLPLAHVFARIIVYVCMRAAITVNIGESIEKAADNLKEIRPHFFASVPRAYERTYIRVTSSVQDAGGIKNKIFKWALGVGYAVSKLQQQKRPVKGLLAFKHKLANKLVFSKIQAALGGNIVYTISGAAPLNKVIAEFFHACGILILEGIGMTENTSFSNVNCYDNYKFGTVGQLGPEIEQKIAPDGEVLFRGKNVMLGYYKNPEETTDTIDKDGWLYTGDIGQIDEDGFLRITDRKKDLIITSGGKNVAPQRVEKNMLTSRYVGQVVVYGDQKKYLTGVVTLDQDQVKDWATKHGIPFSSWEELCKHSKVVELIDNEVQEKNKTLSSFETLKKVLIVPNEFSIDSGELTASLKIKRHVVTENYRAQLNMLYE